MTVTKKSPNMTEKIKISVSTGLFDKKRSSENR